MRSESSWFQSFIDYFIAPKLATSMLIDHNRAEMSLEALVALFVWSVASSAFVGLATGAWAVAGLSGLGAVVCVAVAFSMRVSDKLAWMGAALGVLLGLVWTGVAVVTGGLSSFASSWLLALPVIGLVFEGARLGKWMAASMVALWLGLYVAGDTLPIAESWIGAGWVGAGYADQMRLLEVGALGFGLVTIGLLRERFISWLIYSLRQVAAEANAFVETAPVGLMTIDLEGNIFRSNRASGEIFGHDELMQMHVNDVLEDIDPLSFEAHQEDSDAPPNEECVGVRAGGVRFPAEIAGARLEKDRGVVLVVRDITERREYQDELRSARDNALEASQAKSAFLANMSHELRTPLNAVIGYSEMLIEEAEFIQEDPDIAPAPANSSTAQFLPDLQRIRTAGKHLLALINDILDLSKIEAGKMELHLETFEVRELLDDIESTIRPLAAKKDNHFEVNIDSQVGRMHSDSTKIQQVLFNLLSNACKFTEQGHIALSVQPDADDELVFTVSDNGIGMSQEQLSRVFDAFTQADESTTREFGGTGLGLTITQHFCQELGGEVSVESILDEGTQFHIRLPVNTVSKEPHLQEA